MPLVKTPWGPWPWFYNLRNLSDDLDSLGRWQPQTGFPHTQGEVFGLLGLGVLPFWVVQHNVSESHLRAAGVGPTTHPIELLDLFACLFMGVSQTTEANPFRGWLLRWFTLFPTIMEDDGRVLEDYQPLENDPVHFHDSWKARRAIGHYKIFARKG